MFLRCFKKTRLGSEKEFCWCSICQRTLQALIDLSIDSRYRIIKKDFNGPPKSLKTTVEKCMICSKENTTCYPCRWECGCYTCNNCWKLGTVHLSKMCITKFQAYTRLEIKDVPKIVIGLRCVIAHNDLLDDFETWYFKQVNNI